MFSKQTHRRSGTGLFEDAILLGRLRRVLKETESPTFHSEHRDGRDAELFWISTPYQAQRQQGD